MWVVCSCCQHVSPSYMCMFLSISIYSPIHPSSWSLTGTPLSAVCHVAQITRTHSQTHAACHCFAPMLPEWVTQSINDVPSESRWTKSATFAPVLFLVVSFKQISSFFDSNCFCLSFTDTFQTILCIFNVSWSSDFLVVSGFFQLWFEEVLHVTVNEYSVLQCLMI